MDDGLLRIGQVARASGLTRKALRHYDAVGLLKPADKPGTNGYRGYRPDQIRTAKLIRHLRRLDLPISEIRGLLLADTADQLAALTVHRRRLEARITRLQRQLHELDHLINEDEVAMTDAKPTEPMPPEVERELAASLFNYVWTLLETEQRSPADDARMLHAAHASCFHWMQAGDPVNRVRGEWQCSRVYSVLGRAEPALHHARTAHSLCREEGIGDFDLAFVHEALARAHAVAGDLDASRLELERARHACEDIAEHDRELVLADLDTIWLSGAARTG